MVKLSWSTALEDIAHRLDEYRRLMAWWEQVLPFNLISVQYEDLVADQERVSRQLVEACGLAWDPACLSFHRTRRLVATARMSQVRRPVNGQSVGKWQRYEPLLEFDMEKINGNAEDRPAQLSKSG